MFLYILLFFGSKWKECLYMLVYALFFWKNQRRFPGYAICVNIF